MVLRRAGMDAFEALLEARDQLQKQWRRRSIKSALIGSVAAVIGIAMILNTPEGNRAALLAWSALCFGGTSYVAIRAEPPKAPGRIGALLCGVEDIRALGPLVSRFTRTNARTAPQATVDLKQRRELAVRLLAKIRASDSAIVTDEVRGHIHYLLRHWEHFDIGPGYGTDYYCAILGALEQVGDARSIPYVRRLVASAPPSVRPPLTPLNLLRIAYNGLWLTLIRLGTKGKYQTIDRKRLAEAAQECLAALEARCEDERDAGVLLRPSSASMAEALLRPATSGRQAAGELLRASSRPTED